MRAVYEKLGAPKDAAGYGFKLDDKASDFDKTLIGDYSATAHKLGLSVKQAQGLMEFMDGQVKADAARATEALATRVTEGESALKTAWGQAYEPRSREIVNLVTKYGDPALVDAVKGDALKANPNLALMLGKILDRMAEPGAAGGESGDAATGDRAMTPAQAMAAARALEADPVKGKALTDKSHPQHKAVVDERLRLLQLAEGKAPA